MKYPSSRLFSAFVVLFFIFNGLALSASSKLTQPDCKADLVEEPPADPLSDLFEEDDFAEGDGPSGGLEALFKDYVAAETVATTRAQRREKDRAEGIIESGGQFWIAPRGGRERRFPLVPGQNYFLVTRSVDLSHRDGATVGTPLIQTVNLISVERSLVKQGRNEPGLEVSYSLRGKKVSVSGIRASETLVRDLARMNADNETAYYTTLESGEPSIIGEKNPQLVVRYLEPKNRVEGQRTEVASAYTFGFEMAWKTRQGNEEVELVGFSAGKFSRWRDGFKPRKEMDRKQRSQYLTWMGRPKQDLMFFRFKETGQIVPVLYRSRADLAYFVEKIALDSRLALKKTIRAQK